MARSETIEDFYKEQFDSIPERFKSEIGHFNLFKFEAVNAYCLKPIPYNIRAYFKICFIVGKSVVHYSDKTIKVEKQALLFANPQVPYNWQHISEDQRGYFCVFTENFFHHFGNPKEYSILQPEATPVIELTDDQARKAVQIFEDMYADWTSDYPYKYDRMRTLVYELLHLAVKTQPVKSVERSFSNASEKIATRFLELLEQQFPVDDTTLRLRSSSDFAERLSIHVNHLNKVSQEVLHKPTSVIIQERVLLEAKILLKHSDKAVSEIAYALGFKEKTHFNNFFRKHTQLSPTQFKVI